MHRIPVVSRVATGVVAVIAGLASYIHIFRVARHAGEQALVAGLLPFASDGLIVAGSLALVEDKLDGRQPRWSARLAVWFGVAATSAANVASAHHSVTSRLVAAAPPAAFLLAAELVTGAASGSASRSRGR